MTKKNRKVIKKNKLKNKKRIKKAVILISLFIFIGLAIVGTYYIFTDSKFNIKKIIIKNNQYYTEQEITKAININIGTNIFKVTKSKVLYKLKQLPYIQDIDIHRSLPNNLIVIIKERTSKYLVYNKDTGEYIRLSKEGIILEIIDRAELNNNEMLVFGINFDDNIQTGESIVELEYKKLELYNKVYEKYKKNKIEKEITSIKFENDNIALILNYNLNVIFKEKNLDYDMSILNEILKEIEGQAGTIDMTKPHPIFTNNIN